jgi:hypothetical protein
MCAHKHSRDCPCCGRKSPGYRKGNEAGREMEKFFEFWDRAQRDTYRERFGLSEADAAKTHEGIERLMEVSAGAQAEILKVMCSDLSSWKIIERVDAIWKWGKGEIGNIELSLPVGELIERAAKARAEMPVPHRKGLGTAFHRVVDAFKGMGTIAQWEFLGSEEITRAGIAVSRELKMCLDPDNEEDLRLGIGRGMLKRIRQVEPYLDERVIADLDAFFTKFLSIARSFEKNDAGRSCFIAMCRSIIMKSARQSAGISSGISIADINTAALEINVFPYTMILDDTLLEKIESVAKGACPRAAGAIAANPQWVDPANGFAELKELVRELESCGVRSTLLDIVKGSSLPTAVKLARMFSQHPERFTLFFALNSKSGSTKTWLKPVEYSRYLFQVADEKTGDKTFHDRFCEVLPKMKGRVAVRVIRASESIYLSDIWPDLSQSLEQGKEMLAEDAISAVEGGEFERAAAILRQEREARQAETELVLKDQIEKTFPKAGDEQKALFQKAYARLAALSIDPRRFGALRKHGFEMMAKVAGEVEPLSDCAMTAIFRSDTVRSLFVKALGRCPDEGVGMQLEQIARESQSLDWAEQAMELHLEDLLDDERTVRQGKFGRIILVAGEQVAKTMASSLAENVDIPVVTVTNGDANKAYMGSLLRQGDLVVIGVSHLGHSASNVAIATCRNLGIPFVIRRQTNVDFILKRLGQPDKPSGNGGSHS